ncbi:hypothetical protein FRB91_006257 [Serendipita sp. 411]|nr:hypothetical protein FRB91_006257 [Serendipita sp. 411]
MAERNSFLQVYQPQMMQNVATPVRSSLYSTLQPTVYSSSIETTPSRYPTLNKGTSSRFMLRIACITFAVLIGSVGVGFALLLYLLHGKVEWTLDELVTTVPQGNVLLITTMIGKVILTLVPLAIGISAYWVADGWIRDTKAITHNKPTSGELPTPYQYSLLLSIFQGASLFSLATTIHYLIKSTSTSRSITSRQLFQAFIVLCIALFLSYGLVGTDFALHSFSTTRLVSVRGGSLDLSLATKLNGRRLKDDCNHPTVNGSACTLGRFGTFGLSQIVDFKEGLRILGGFSSSSQISFSPSISSNGYAHPVALLTDANPSPTISFSASTIGLSTKCGILTSTCDLSKPCNDDFHPPTIHRGYTNNTGWDHCSAWACTAEGWPRFWTSGFRNQTQLTISEPLELRGEPEVVEGQVVPNDPSVGHNPFRIMMTSSTYIEQKILEEVCAETSPSGSCIRGKDTGYLYSGAVFDYPSPRYRLSLIGCSVSVVEIDYSYLNGTYTVDHSTARLADNATTWAISSVLYSEDTPLPYMDNSVFNFASSGGESSGLATLIEQKLSRLLLAMSHSAFEPTPILSLSSALQLLATVLPTPTLITFFVFILCFATFVVVLAATAFTSSTTAFRTGQTQGRNSKQGLVSAVEIANQRLREPTGLIYKVFEEETDDRQLWTKDGIEMFKEGQGSQPFHGSPGGVRDVRIGLGVDGSFGFH